jgi:hypothetical protein
MYAIVIINICQIAIKNMLKKKNGSPWQKQLEEFWMFKS